MVQKPRPATSEILATIGLSNPSNRAKIAPAPKLLAAPDPSAAELMRSLNTERVIPKAQELIGTAPLSATEKDGSK